MPTKPLKTLIQNEAYRIVLLQLVGIIALTVIASLVRGMQSAGSILAGGLVYWLANIVFVWRVFRYAGAHQMGQFVTAFFLGETLKLVISAILFLLIVKYLPVSLLSTLIGFIGAIVSFWIACVWHFSKKAVRSY